uniref:N-acetyltransferase domain-containing protein n=1 Tax=Peronospora matthiolae TaxID=2874970 RepID=A0AAV1T3I1_9STRA
MELRCLTDDGALVRAVQKHNLGVLPVQPPPFCYRRAERDRYRLSWAAVTRGTCIVRGAAVAELELERGGRRTVQLRTLAVSPQFRRQGVGRAIMEKLIQQVKKVKEKEGEDIQVVSLHVHAGNDEALTFYEAQGFVRKAEIDDYYRHLEPRTAVVMEFLLD